MPVARIDHINLPIDLTKVARNSESPIGSPSFNEGNSDKNGSKSLQFKDHQIG